MTSDQLVAINISGVESGRGKLNGLAGFGDLKRMHDASLNEGQVAREQKNGLPRFGLQIFHNQIYLTAHHVNPFLFHFVEMISANAADLKFDLGDVANAIVAIVKLRQFTLWEQQSFQRS